MNGTPTELHPSRRWLLLAFWLIVCALGALRFVHLAADFPNDSPWMTDQAKFTDEGWWASAAVAHSLTGHWYLPGDYNPAVALPIWPLLLSAVFRFTGVSAIAARAFSVVFSLATFVLVYALVRRYMCSSSNLPAVVSVVLLALSPFAFAFSRLAILDTLVIFEMCLALFIASLATRRRIWPLAVLAALVSIMLLTKTTSAILIPAIFWLAFSVMGRNTISFLRAALAAVLVPAVVVKGYAALAATLGYGADYKYFFLQNALDDYHWSQTFATFAQFLRSCFSIDRVLFPLALIILVFSIAAVRRLWSNPLYTASWLAVAGSALYIIRRQDDGAPRYFLVMLVPLILIVVLALDEALKHFAAIHASPHRLWRRRITALAPLLLAISASAAANAVMLAHFIANPEYQFSEAANSIREIVRSHPVQKPLILSVSGPQLSLMTGIPSINDGYGTEPMAEKVARYQPGWYLAWTAIPAEAAGFLAPYQLDKAASYPVFDDPERTPLILYKLVRRTP